jgi:RHS repeat-associated protein
LTELRDPRDQVHRFAYDTLGRLVADSAPDGGFKLLARSSRDTGYTVTITTAMNRATSYSLDMLSDKTERRAVIDAAGFVTRSWRTPSGIDSTRTADGTLTVVHHGGDPRFGTQVPLPGRVVVRLPSNDSMVITSRRASVRSDSTNPFSLTQQIDSTRVNEQLWRSVYEAATRQATVTTPEGRQTITRTDSLGRRISDRQVGLDSLSYQYDARGRLSQVRSGGRVWTYGYDASGRLLSTLDPLGRRDSLFYDTADRLSRRVLPGGREVLFSYDSSGNVTSVTPPGRPAHGFGYTSVDLTNAYTPPNVGLTTPATAYSYNVDRQLTQITRPDSVAIDFGYEPTTGRLSTLTFDRGQLGYGYSPTTGNLTSITAPGGNTLTYTYDGALPKTATWAGVVQGSVGVGYNTDFRVTSMTVNGANSLAFGYDRDGLLTTAGALGIKRHAQHGLVERDSLGAMKTSWSYSPRGALAGYVASNAGSIVFQTSYVRDSLDRITQLTETVLDTTRVLAFSYDSAGRLEEVLRNGSVTATYEYDLNGNRTRLTTPSGIVTGTYDAQDRLTTYGANSYTYGSNGELKTKTDASGTSTYAYDALGNLTAATLPDGTQITYVIDGQNRRVGKRVNGVLVQGFLYQGQLSPVAELDENHQVVSRFIFGTHRNVPDYMVKDGVTYRLIPDQLGSVRLVVNTSDGAVAQRLDYDEYGRVTQNTAPGFQPFGFAGGILDNQTGLVRFGARDYDPGTGRWTAKDPVGFRGGGNFYSYVAGDPVNLVDQTGYYPIPTCYRDLLQPYFPGIDLGAVDLQDGVPPGFAGAAGVTIGNTIYLYDQYADRTIEGQLALLAHELQHVEQYEQYGFGGFGLRYLEQGIPAFLKTWDVWDAAKLMPLEVYGDRKSLEVLADLKRRYPNAWPCPKP